MEIWDLGEGEPNEMTKPVKTMLSGLHITQLGQGYYLPSFQMLCPHLTLFSPLFQTWALEEERSTLELYLCLYSMYTVP